jgi:hypothetical protein
MTSHDLAAVILDGILQVHTKSIAHSDPPPLPEVLLPPYYRVYVFSYQVMTPAKKEEEGSTEPFEGGLAVTNDGAYVAVLQQDPVSVSDIHFHLAPQPSAPPATEGEPSGPDLVAGGSETGFLRVFADPFTKLLTCTLFPYTALERLEPAGSADSVSQ